MTNRTFVAFSIAQFALLTWASGLTASASAMEITRTLHPVVIKAASYTVDKHDVTVFVEAYFPNECYANAEKAKIFMSDQPLNIVIAESHEMVCPSIYDPVSRQLVIKHRLDIPNGGIVGLNIRVNGVIATARGR